MNRFEYTRNKKYTIKFLRLSRILNETRSVYCHMSLEMFMECDSKKRGRICIMHTSLRHPLYLVRWNEGQQQLKLFKEYHHHLDKIDSRSYEKLLNFYWKSERLDDYLQKNLFEKAQTLEKKNFCCSFVLLKIRHRQLQRGYKL